MSAHVTVSMAERPKTAVRPMTTRGRHRGSVESLSSSQDESQKHKTISSQEESQKHKTISSQEESQKHKTISSQEESQKHKTISSQEESQSVKNNEEKERRLLNRSRAQTAPTSKYHSSCSLSSSSSDSLGSSGTGSLLRAKSMDSYPTPDTIHLTCRVSNDKPGYYEFLRPYSAYTTPLWKPPKLPEGFRDSKKLNHKALTEGEKFYLWRTARVYGMSNMKKQNQFRYEKILTRAVETGFHTEEEVQKYRNYFNGTRKRQFEADPTVWRSPPRIPVRPLQFRKPPTSPRGWNSYSPQGSLGKGRANKANSSLPGDENGKAVDKKKALSGDENGKAVTKKKTGKQKKNGRQKNEKEKSSEEKKNKSLLEEILDDDDDTRQEEEEDQKKDEDQKQEDKTDSSNDNNVKSEKQSAPKIYYDMKLRRTVVKPGTEDASEKENSATGKTGSSKQNNKVTWKDQRMSKTAGPQRIPRSRVSWEDPDKSAGPGIDARPKTSRGRMQRVKSAKQRGKPEEDVDARDNERVSPDSRGTPSSMSNGSSGTSSSGTSSSGSGSSYSSSSGDSSRSNSTLKGHDEVNASNAVPTNNWENEDEARAALAKSFWNKTNSQEDGDKTSDKQEEDSDGESNKVEYVYSSLSEGSSSRSSSVKGQHKGERSNSQEEETSTSSPRSAKGSSISSKSGSSRSSRSSSSQSNSSVKGERSNSDEETSTSPRSAKSGSKSGSSSSRSSSSQSNSSVKVQQEDVPMSERSNAQKVPIPSASSPRSTQSSRSSSSSGTNSSSSGSSSGSSSSGSASSSNRSSNSSVKGYQEGESSQTRSSGQSLVSDDENDEMRAYLAKSFWDKK